MVHCPQCGVANSDDSKLCRECGSALPPGSAGVRCPMCSHSNPEGRETCERCNARLTPLVAPPPSSDLRDSMQVEVPSPLPSVPSGEHPRETPPIPGTEEDEGGADWLQRMRESALSEDPPPPDWSETEPLLTESPDWLSRLESEPAETPVEDAEPASTDTRSEEDVPDWLAELTSAEEAPAEDAPMVAPSLTEVPAWLAEMVSEEDVPGAEDSTAQEPVDAGAADWLAAMMPAEDAPVENAPEEDAPVVEVAAEGEVPDWLAELTPAEDVPVEEGAIESEVPDWLPELPPEEEEPAGEVAAEGEVPDWLAELTPAEEEPVEEEPVAEGAVESEVPDWLAGTPSEEEEPAGEVAAEGEVPDWLAELTPAEDVPVEEDAVLQASVEADAPDWVAEQSSTEKGPVEEVLTPESASPEVEIADWLAAMMPVEDAAVEETPVAEDAVEAEVPDWLAQMITPGESEAGLPPLVDAETEELLEEVAPTGEEPVILAPEQVKVPDWLLSAAPSESDKEAPLGEVALESEQPDLVQAEIPAWLQAMRPDVAPTPVSIEEEREVETDGLLAGIAGVVQAASVVTAVPSVTAKPEGIGAEATTARARLWQELIARSAQPSPRELPRSAEGKTRYQVERWVVYAIVFVAVVVPLVVDVDLTTVFDLDQPLTAEAGVAYDLVNDVVTQGAPVLLAFDYGPAYMGELDLQAASLLRHLSLRQARIIAMSLTPEGAGLAQRLIDDVLIKEGYQSGQDYVNLGYFPGDAAGIRALRFLPPHFQNQTFDGMELQDALVFDDGERFELGDMALIAVLTSDDDNLRWWVEQTTALEGELETELPLLAGVSAAIEALVRPYYDMELPQIDGLVIGLAGAADYERALGQMDGPAHTRLEAQLVGQGAVLALIVIAVLFYGLFRKGESDG